VYNTRRRRHGKDMAGEEPSPGVFCRTHGKDPLPGVKNRHTAKKSGTPFHFRLTAHFLCRVSFSWYTAKSRQRPRHRYFFAGCFIVGYTAKSNEGHAIAISSPSVSWWGTRQRAKKATPSQFLRRVCLRLGHTAKSLAQMFSPCFL
jgi:hypothetical protein